MELPILEHIPLPDLARRIVLQFLRKPHATTALIKVLEFWRDEEIDQWNPNPRHRNRILKYLFVGGPGVRTIAKHLTCHPPVYYNRIGCAQMFYYDEATGERYNTLDDELGDEAWDGELGDEA